jgi:hypothetical protein
LKRTQLKVKLTQTSEEAKIISECTFHPIVNESVCSITDDFYERGLQWQQKVALKVKLLEEEVSCKPPRPMSPVRYPDHDSFSEDVPLCESPVADIEERYAKLSDFLDEIAKKVDQTLCD